MTCEVAVMNKYAVVIAADSAVTTTDASSGAERYSKGGNKIFQLSHYDPVGVMIFGSARLGGVPWEIIIKDFRDTLSKTTYSTLAEYSKAFFDFLKVAKHFFPASDLDTTFFSSVTAIAIRVLKSAREADPKIDDQSLSLNDRVTAWEDYVNQLKAGLNKTNLHKDITPQNYKDGQAAIAAQIPKDKSITDYLAAENLAGIVDPVRWFELACETYFKNYESVLGETGIVFSGYGKNQYFPEVIQYSVWGFVRYDFLFELNKGNSAAIGHNVPSGIFQFAMTSSIQSFTKGVDLTSFSAARRTYKIHAKKLALDALNNAKAPVPPNIDTLVNASEDEWSDDWVDEILELHYHPLKRVIASLPVDEMVHLAETLIMLQSLKERMTTHSESVSGPIDVAVITKSEGLVWIKRKHFFDSAKNLRYALRQQALFK